MATLAVTNTFSAGTTIVASEMNTNFDDIEAFVNTTPGVVQADIVDAKGDIIAATAADTVGRLAVGTDTYVLTADSGEATGLIWAAPTTGDITGVTAGTNISGGGTSGTVTVNLAIDAAVDFGSDGSGVDVSFHSATAGDLMLWDASDEKLVITGTNGQNSLEVADGNVSITDDLAVTGNVTIQGLDMDTIVAGDVIYGSGADTLARLAKGSDDEVLTLASGVPSWAAASAGGISWSGSTANGLGTYSSSSEIVAESTATYDGTTLTLTGSGGGLKMNGLDSSDANTLDDYEEGYWTAAATVTSGTLVVDVNANILKYTKIGSRVFITGNLPTFSTASGLSGTWKITGLPFANTNTQSQHEGDANAMGLGSLGATASDIDPGTPYGFIMKNESQIRWGTQGTTASGLDASVIDTGTFLMVWGSYTTDS